MKRAKQERHRLQELRNKTDRRVQLRYPQIQNIYKINDLGRELGPRASLWALIGSERTYGLQRVSDLVGNIFGPSMFEKNRLGGGKQKKMIPARDPKQ